MVELELVAVILGLICVWLTVQQHIGCWPTGLAMVLLYIAIFYHTKLYSDMLLQVVYVFLQVYGWYAWLYAGPRGTPLEVSRLTAGRTLAWASVATAGTWGLGTFMHQKTDAAFPYADAFTTVASLIAQWLMGRKVLESWLVWIVVDLVSVGIYVAKSLYLTAGLYSVFLLLATLGFIKWKRTLPTLATA